MSQEQPKSQAGGQAGLDSGEQVRDSSPRAFQHTRPSGLKLATFAPSASMADTDLQELLARQGGERDPFIGATIDGRYRIERVLGEGGMGVVYQCTHTIIGKKVAMKVLRADMARDTEVTERFLNEAKAASTIGNQHIIDISDFGRLPDGSTYFIMEFLEGKPLTTVIEKAGSSGMPVSRILHVAIQLSEGLGAAHLSQIVHRDLKPDNIFLIERGKDPDFVKILDFGIAKVSTTGGSKLTRAGAVFGTPHYMSPEQAAGAPVDHRGDIYSFGVILYEMASGKVPFDADNFMGILTQHMYKAPVPIRALVPEPQAIPPGLEAVILKCLSKRAEQRYQSMDELREELLALQSGSVPAAVPEMMSRSGGFNVPADYFKNAKKMQGPVPANPGVAGRSPGILIASIATLCLVAAVGGGAVFLMNRPTAQAAPEASPSAVSNATSANNSATPPTPTVATVAPVKETTVVLTIVPADARAFDGDRDLGSSPVLLKVAEGSKLKLRISRDGYEAKVLEVDGSTEKLAEQLVKLPTAPAPRPRVNAPRPQPAPAPVARPRPRPVGGGGDVVDPWK